MTKISKSTATFKNFFNFADQAEQLSGELASEKAASAKWEGEAAQLERHNRDLKAKLADLDKELKTRSKAMLAEMERKIALLQEQLDNEQK
jgi:myosin protein heavy chain